jgi:hypothetical protein
MQFGELLRFDVLKSSRTRLSARLSAQATTSSAIARFDLLTRRAPEVRTRKRQHRRVGGAQADEACA